MYLNIRRLVIGSAWFFCVLFAQSCSSTQSRHIWIGEGIRAENLQERGKLDEATRIYDKLLKSPPDTERRRWIEYQRAELAYEQGENDRALKLANILHSENVDDEYGAKALFLIAQLTPDNEPKLLWEVIKFYPQSYQAEKALKALEASAIETGDLVDFSNRTREEIQRGESQLVDNLLLAEARSHIKLDRPNEALHSLRELYFLDEKDSLSDDALWEMAEIYRSAQQWEDALDVYNVFRKRIESSWYVGSYTPHLVDDSIFESGKICLLHLNKYRRARAFFEDYLVLFPEAILADDALWFIAESYRLEGDSEAQEESLERLKKTYPTSRFVRRAEGDLP